MAVWGLREQTFTSIRNLREVIKGRQTTDVAGQMASNGELNGDDRANDSRNDSLSDSVNSTYQAIKANPGIQKTYF